MVYIYIKYPIKI